MEPDRGRSHRAQGAQGVAGERSLGRFCGVRSPAVPQFREYLLFVINGLGETWGWNSIAWGNALGGCEVRPERSGV